MSSVAEIEADLKELQGLKAQATRVNNQTFLNSKIKELEKKLTEKKSSETAAQKTSTPSVVSTNALLATSRLTNYAMDQSDKFVKLYIPLKGIQDVPAANITTNFQKRECEVIVNGLNNMNYCFSKKGLLNEIIPESSQIKQKTDDLLIMLRKKDAQNWDTLTELEHADKEKNRPKMDESADPQASLMNMMKEMYDTGDDEMKRNIKKAWFEGQNKNGGMMPPM
ncbi:unnamed protein product [Auanema sp. JU1783]|nr:unnamed protein product [Auanema sp. JU1783]